jgi:RNA 2',3'-cyclic 3'-phosphodiesterase
MRHKRIFIAIDISADARRVCSDHIDCLRNEFHAVRVGWERPEKLHITLKFLGDVDDRLLNELQKYISYVASHHRTFHLKISRPGVFPSRSKPRILWLGVEDGSNVGSSLYNELDTACIDLGFKSEARSFKPHITIGRVREPEKADALARKHLERQIEPVAFEVAEIVLYQSDLQPTGSVYSVVSSARLGRT